MTNGNIDPSPDPPSTRIEITQHTGTMTGSEIIGASIGQATAQRDLIIQTFQTLHERALTAEEAAKAAADLELLARLGRGRLAVLHAESGAGKSSLLQAGIAEDLPPALQVLLSEMWCKTETPHIRASLCA